MVVLATVHNLHFYLALMREARSAIMTGRFAQLRARLAAPGTAGDEEK